MSLVLHDSVLVGHPSRLLGEALDAALQEAGIGPVHLRHDLAAMCAALAKAPVQLTVAAVELAGTGVADMVSALLSAGSRSVVVLAPEVLEADLLGALEAGALGYLSRDQPLERLVYDVRGALRGEACLPRNKLAPVLRLLIERRRTDDERSERLRRLSKRETEVLSHLGRGSSNDEIAGELFLSQATVRTHVQNILGKLGVHSRLEAIALVQDSGTFPSSD